MKLSPLQLSRYVITDVGCTADPDFNPEKGVGAALEHLSVNVKTNQLASEKNMPGHSWSVELEIVQKKAEGQNLPYAFHVSIFGIFDFLDGAAESEKEKHFVQVNGSSILFAMAREQVRTLTAAGPWGVVILPTMSFYDKKEETKNS
jgi:preprotein translocase subunit SecB